MNVVAGALIVLALTMSPAAAQPLICFGNEPSWSVDLTAVDRARFAAPDSAAIDYTGQATVNPVLRERMWRGRTPTGGDLVIFLRDGTCSDGLSDLKYPVSARVSTPQGAFLVGCCRVPVATTPTPLDNTAWRLVGMEGQTPAAITALRRSISIRFEAGRVSGFSGCNAFSGPFSVSQNRVRFGDLTGTMMACGEPAAARLEEAFKNALASPATFVMHGDRLTLTYDSGAVLTFQKERRGEIGKGLDTHR
jgi:heat shock protein HslJ